jgi:magnesium and cobalt transporter
MTDENENSKPGDEGTPDVGGGLVSRLRGLLGGRNANENLRDTIEELIEQEDGDVDGESVDLTLFRNVLAVRDVTVYDVMVPRADIIAVDASSSLADVAKLMSDSGHSRLPVFRGQLDDVIGMVHIKDLLACWEDDTGSRIDKIARKALFVAPSMPVLQLLLQMRSQRIHMAVVVDEFGGIDGLVTIEDLVEEIVGEIEDEHDEETKPKIVRKGDDILDIDARVEIEDLESEIGPLLTDEERDEDIDTVGGLVFYVAGRVPGRGEVIRHDSGLEFEILDADPRRIRRVRASKLPTRSEE